MAVYSKKKVTSSSLDNDLTQLGHLLQESPLDEEKIFKQAALIREKDGSMELFEYLVTHFKGKYKADVNKAFILYRLTGDSLRHVRQYEDALPYYQKALELRENHCDTHYRMGLTLQKLGCSDEALQSFENALNMDSTQTDIFFYDIVQRIDDSDSDYENEAKQQDKIPSIPGLSYADALDLLAIALQKTNHNHEAEHCKQMAADSLESQGTPKQETKERQQKSVGALQKRLRQKRESIADEPPNARKPTNAREPTDFDPLLPAS